MRSIQALLCALLGLAVSQSTPSAVQRIDLAERLTAGKLRVVNRQATRLSPIDWVPLRIVVRGPKLQVSVGLVANLTLDVRKLGTLDRGLVGLWVGNISHGDFANLRITPVN